MKRNKALSIVLALALALSLLPAAVFADDGITDEAADAIELTAQSVEDVTLNAAAVSVLQNGGSITASNINGSTAAVYQTPAVEKYSQDFTYNVKMPAAGTMIVSYYSSDSCYVRVNNASFNDSETIDDIKVGYYYVGSAGTASLKLSVYNTGAYANFSVAYAPATATLNASTTETTYILGRPNNSSTVSSYKLKVGSAGYLILKMGDGRESYNSSICYKTKGFKDYEYLSASDYTRYVGVKKGTYTISVKSYTPVYGIKVKFKKVKQGKYGTKKAKAAKLKKKATRKGLIITNAKKAHWYKFKNPKLQKVTVKVNGKLSSGNSSRSYGLKITIYDKRGNKVIEYYSQYFKTLSIPICTLGKGKKLAKGTYWIKIESYKGGNGYFTVKWQ